MTSDANLHEACYRGELGRVRALLDAGADPNAPAPSGGREWISSSGRSPRPLNCVATAWNVTDDHVQIAHLLIERGAIVDDTVVEDHALERTGSASDAALAAVLEAAHRSNATIGPARSDER